MFNIGDTLQSKVCPTMAGTIIKLDKNFHIYIHGDRQKLAQGEDENGKYYMLYFEKEV